MVAGEKFIKMKGKYLEPKAYLIDTNIFGGNSGGPVLQQMYPLSHNMRLLGLIQAGTSKDAKEDLEFGVVEPASRIGETIESSKKQSVDIVNIWVREDTD
ncbi:MAG: hypothetical protein SV375_00355 [Thermodesulfobacteriota bacterium]|nr:hypothetical protein [Thermodesulfobacteriota bacterium]